MSCRANRGLTLRSSGQSRARFAETLRDSAAVGVEMSSHCVCPRWLTPLARAGRLLRVTGWAVLAASLGIAAAVVLPGLVRGDSFEAETALSAGLGVGWAVACLLVASFVADRKPWAFYCGLMLALVALTSYPLGTAIGVVLLVYLVRGWSDRERVA
jgi:hypothetical protein